MSLFSSSSYNSFFVLPLSSISSVTVVTTVLFAPFSSSDEEEEEKTFVDYIPSKDIIGDLENEHIDDEDDRLKELIKKKNNLKEI